MDRRVNEDQPSSWQDVVELGVGVARAVLGEEPKKDPRPWVRGGEAELLVLDRSLGPSRKRSAETAEQWHDANVDVRRSKRRRLRWLKDREVRWWDQKVQAAQDKADQGDAFGLFATFRELRSRGASIPSGEVAPKDAQAEQDAWAEHFRLIGEGPGRRQGLGQRAFLPPYGCYMGKPSCTQRTPCCFKTDVLRKSSWGR